MAVTAKVQESVKEAQPGSASWFSSVFRSIGCALIVTDRAGRVALMNPAAQSLTGWKDVEATGKPLEEVFRVVEESGEGVKDWAEWVIREGGTTKLSDRAVLLTRDGSETWIEGSVSLVEDESENVAGAVVVFQEIADRRRTMEEELSAEKSRAQKYLDVAGTIFLAIEADQKVSLVNKKGCDVLGYTEEEIVGKNWFDNFVPARLREEMKAVFKDLISGDDLDVEFYENAVSTRDGEERIIAWHNTVLKDEEGNIVGTLSSGEDVTEHRAMEEEKERINAQLLQAQKMEAMGRLAGGVAHDFNNLLTAITGYGGLLLNALQDNGQLHDDVEEIMKAAKRASSLTRQLLAFSRKQVLQPQLMNPNDLIADLSKLLKRLVGEDIELVTMFEPGLWRVLADQGNMEQVVMNLVVNAREAMPQGGQLIVETENIALDEETCRFFPGGRAGEFVCISVSDTGIGMHDDTLEHVFEPFFSTKEQGTGLGLAVVYGIVRNHNGWINVYSRPDQGSTFQVYLPAFSERGVRDEREGSKTALQSLRGRGERVLLVEDEEGVREYARKALGRNGYVIFEASCVEEALNIFDREEGRFQLVLSDVVLPGRSGLQLVDDLLLRNPGLPMLLSSGYTDRKSQWAVIKERGFRYLQKPYTLSELLRAVKDALEVGHKA